MPPFQPIQLPRAISVDKGDDTVYDNGYIHLPAGHIVSTGIPIPLDDYMKMNVRIEGGASSVTYQAQVAAVAPTSVTPKSTTLL